METGPGGDGNRRAAQGERQEKKDCQPGKEQAEMTGKALEERNAFRCGDPFRKDIRSLDLRSLRRKMGVVTQDGSLFQGDIYSNITVSAPQLTLDESGIRVCATIPWDKV